MEDKIKFKVREFITEDDKHTLYDECCEAIEFMTRRGIDFEDAIYTVKNIVRQVRNNYGD